MLKGASGTSESHWRFLDAISFAEASNSTCDKCRDAAILRPARLRPGLLATPPVRDKSAGTRAR